MDTTFGRKFSTSLLDVTLGRHFWMSLFDDTFGRNFWTAFIFKPLEGLLPEELDGATDNIQTLQLRD